MPFLIQSKSRPKSLPNPTPEVDIGSMSSTLSRGSYLNQGFIPDENENWSEIALQPSGLKVPQLQPSGQEVPQLQPSGLQVPQLQLGESDQPLDHSEDKERSRSHAVKKYLKDQINERIKGGDRKDQRKDTWSAVITSVMSNGMLKAIANNFHCINNFPDYVPSLQVQICTFPLFPPFETLPLPFFPLLPPIQTFLR